MPTFTQQDFFFLQQQLRRNSPWEEFSFASENSTAQVYKARSGSRKSGEATWLELTIGKGGVVCPEAVFEVSAENGVSQCKSHADTRQTLWRLPDKVSAFWVREWICDR